MPSMLRRVIGAAMSIADMVESPGEPAPPELVAEVKAMVSAAEPAIIDHVTAALHYAVANDDAAVAATLRALADRLASSPLAHG